jgi:hypothetical protein
MQHVSVSVDNHQVKNKEFYYSIPEKLTVPQLVKEYSAFYGT